MYTTKVNSTYPHPGCFNTAGPYSRSISCKWEWTKIPFCVVLAVTAVASPAWAAETEESVGVFHSIDPAHVKVGGEIGRRIDTTILANLLMLDVENQFLKPFREKLGEPKDPHGNAYVGLGKLIDATVSFARYTNDPKVTELKDSLIRELIATQLEDGYIGMKPPGHRIFELWDLHEMVYILHALVNEHRYFQNKKSLDAARKLADYLLKNRKGSDPPRDTGKLDTERALIALSEATSDARYRDYAVDGMDLRNWNAPVAGHAYTFMNLCLAQLDLYREKPDESLLTQSRRVIDYLTNNNGLTITGTCSHGEGFHDNQDTRGNLGESCATAYLIRLTHYLLKLEGKSLDGDIMERAIYNALFAAQSPDGRKLRYFTCVDGPREYFDRDTYCCPGNWRRIVAELPEMIYYRSLDGGVLVNLYTASSAEVTITNDLSVHLRQDTDYPNSGKVAITVEPSQPAEFTVMLRIPRWCDTATVAINGQVVDEPVKPGDRYAIKRLWKAGDVVVLDMPMKARLVRGRKLQAGKVAMMHGPVVFCFNPSRQKELVQLRARLSDVSAKLGYANGDPLDLADIIAGGNGLGGGTPGNGIDVLNGQRATGPTGDVAVTVNKYIATDHPFIHGIVIPDGGKDGPMPVPITATGLTAAVPGTSGRTWDHVRSGPVASQDTTVVGNVDYLSGRHTMVSVHANKAITFDLGAIRKTTGYGEMQFRAKACYGGKPEPTVDYAVLVDGKPVVERRAISRQPQEIDVSLPPESHFLTLVVTDQNRDISHDQAFFGDAALTPVRFKATAEAVLLSREKQAIQAKIAQYPAMADTQGKTKFDITSLAGPIPDKTVRPDGFAMEVRAWGPSSDRSKPAELTLLLTEYTDPAGEMTYFAVDDPNVGVEDELYATPPASGKEM